MNKIMSPRNFQRYLTHMIFSSKVLLLQLFYGFCHCFNHSIKKHKSDTIPNAAHIIGESRTALWPKVNNNEYHLIAGKVENLRIAAKHLNGLFIPINDTFSFWKQLGKLTRYKGYKKGRELREGCLIPSVGGGICQLSNALYDAALQAGFDIVERHQHSQVVPGSLAEVDRDATVFWNYIDLKFRPSQNCYLVVKITAKELILQFKALTTMSSKTAKPHKKILYTNSLNNCQTCQEASCFRAVTSEQNDNLTSKTAFLVDSYWPEFDQHIQKTRRSTDVLLAPMNGKRWQKRQYQWSASGFSKVYFANIAVFRRALQARFISKNGKALQLHLAKHQQLLVKSYAKKLDYLTSHLVIEQSLLLSLHHEGLLAGRTYDVLMSRFPLNFLQTTLDIAHQKNPSSTTLADFRVSKSQIELETHLLKSARRIISSHTQIQKIFHRQSFNVSWYRSENISARISKNKKNQPLQLFFPASSLGRKGAYELRQALESINCELILLGKATESIDFWKGQKIRFFSPEDWKNIDIVILPAYVAHSPRIILEAIGRNIPVVISQNCGIPAQAGVYILENITSRAIIEAINQT